MKDPSHEPPAVGGLTIDWENYHHGIYKITQSLCIHPALSDKDDDMKDR